MTNPPSVPNHLFRLMDALKESADLQMGVGPWEGLGHGLTPEQKAYARTLQGITNAYLEMYRK